MNSKKTVLISGASGGLGSCLAREYIHRGYFTIGCDLSCNSKIQTLLSQSPRQFKFYIMNIGDDASVAKAESDIKKDFDVLDIIINAAGILPAGSANVLEKFDINSSLEVYNVNALGSLRVTKAFLDLLKRGDDKVLVNISSEAGSMATNNNYIIRYDYCMSKAAVNMQSVILQRYLKPDGIKVLAVHPGWMKTDMGGARALIEPETSARGIADLAAAYRHRLDEGIYFDYDGSRRAW